MRTFLIWLLTLLSVSISWAQGYYPLHAGDIWQYRDMFDSSYAFTTWALGDTLMPNGKTYMHLKSDHELDDQYFRQSGSIVYRYSTLSQTEQNWKDFSKSTTDTVTVQYGPYDTTIITVAFQEMRDVFGVARLSWGFYEKFAPLIYNYALREVTDSIGLTYYTYEPGIIVDVLSGAIIDGITRGTITEVATDPPPSPASMRLLQNYPNPFNPSTQIRFTLPKAADVTLKIFNVLGEEVVTLLAGREEPGEHAVVWDASKMPSGVYFYRLSAGGFLQTKKMVLMK